jgi:hypothetical protein
MNGRTSTHVHAWGLCALARRTVIRAYRARLPWAREIDAAHARLWQRSGGRGTFPVDDPDVVTIIDAALALDDLDVLDELDEIDRERAKAVP